MTIIKSAIIKKILIIIILILGIGSNIRIFAESKDEFTVVIDAGHGGKDFGAIDNNAKEKDINLEVALRLAELIKKKMKGTEVVMTRDDDTFISLQGRADIANKSKGDLFISIHTNSVDTKNKNRATVAGASVYTLGGNKDDANMEIARRENSVIELENSYEQKYSGFDPNKDESYIIFEMAQKKNLSQSNRFAKMVQDNLVKIAGRKDRGVKQAGFWVLWSTSMPSVLVELDFICNPESAEFLTSKDGVDQLADAIFQAVKVYEQNYKQSLRMAQNGEKNVKGGTQKTQTASSKKSGSKNSKKKQRSEKSSGGETDVKLENSAKDIDSGIDSDSQNDQVVGISYKPAIDDRDKSHAVLEATQNQRKPRTTSDGRRRRSNLSKNASDSRIVEGEIALQKEFKGESLIASNNSEKEVNETPKDDVKQSKTDKKDKKKTSKKASAKKQATSKEDKKADKAGSEKKSKSLNYDRFKAKNISKVNKEARAKESAKAKEEKSKEETKKSKTDNHAGRRKSLKNKEYN